MLMVNSLPTRLGHPGEESLEGQLSEADTTELELTHIAPGSATDAAAIALTNLELGLAKALGNTRFLCHGFLLALSERHAETGKQSSGLVIGRRRRGDGDVHPECPLDLLIVDLGEDEDVFDAQRIVATSVESAR